jgi:hypothetical protein
LFTSTRRLMCWTKKEKIFSHILMNVCITWPVPSSFYPLSFFASCQPAFLKQQLTNSFFRFFVSLGCEFIETGCKIGTVLVLFHNMSIKKLSNHLVSKNSD